jgi:GR25 family glycosyltransferase involved in LPS biosynthesis
MRKTHQRGAAIYHHRNAFTVHSPVFPGIDDIWMVSLDRRADRWASWKAATPAFAPITNRLPAIDGKLLELTQNLFTFFERNDFSWKKSVAGCALSHTLLWAQLASEQSFVKNYLILEDDQRFIRTDWQPLLKAAMAAAPADAELLYLGGVLPGNLAAYSSCLNPVNDIWATIKPNQYFSSTPAPVFHFCAYAYVLTRSGAQKLCHALGRSGCPTSIDHFLVGIGLKKYVLRDLMATCYQIDDPKYKESEFDNFDRVDQFDSDIWNNKDCFTDFGDFEKEIQPPPLYQVLADTLTQAPHSIQTRNTLKQEAIQLPPNNSKIVYYFNRMDGKDHDGTLEEGWLRTLWPDFTFRSMTQPFVPGSWILVARPQMAVWCAVATQLDGKGVPFQVLHLSDEFGKDPVDFYQLGCCRRVVRNYWREDCSTLAKVVTIPLGFARSAPTLANEADRPYVWSFHGTNWFGRRELLEPLMALGPHSCKWQMEFMDASMTPASDYSTLLSHTQFVPVPGGNNPETFRLYEALEHGCIPVYVRSKGDERFWNWICRWLPLQELLTWSAAADQIRLWQTGGAEAYRKQLQEAWASWKGVCKRAFQL